MSEDLVNHLNLITQISVAVCQITHGNLSFEARTLGAPLHFAIRRASDADPIGQWNLRLEEDGRITTVNPSVEYLELENKDSETALIWAVRVGRELLVKLEASRSASNRS